MYIMKTLLVLGNGFDLDLGWKTSFNDFYVAKRQKFDLYNGLSYIADIATHDTDTALSSLFLYYK